MKNRHDSLNKNDSEDKDIKQKVLPELSYANSYDISVVWNYDGLYNCTWFTVNYKDPLLKDKLAELFKKFDDFEQRDDSFVFSRNSLIPEIII